MGEREALLLAVCNDPDAPTPKLVYADWLEERGEELRAECIRLSVALQDPARVAKLIVANEAKWAGLAMQALEREWSGGFVCSVDVSAHKFFYIGPQLFAQHPIVRVNLVQYDFTELPPPYMWQRPSTTLSLMWNFVAPRQYLDFDVQYDTREDAEDALSDACVAWARDRVRTCSLTYTCPLCSGDGCSQSGHGHDHMLRCDGKGGRRGLDPLDSYPECARKWRGGRPPAATRGAESEC